MCSRIADVAGILAIDFDRCDTREILDAYQDLALLFYARPEDHGTVLLKTGNEDADIHYALHDIVRTMVRVVGNPRRLRVAVVGRSSQIGHVCATMRRVLRPLGCELRLFAREGEAVQWLLSGEPRLRAPAAAVAAIPEPGSRCRRA